jgi:ankyrin repeat protein
MGATFEAAADAIVGGDIRSLAEMTRESPQLIRARSNRPHHATLLHYLAANGVEGERQKSPKNAVEIATLLLNSGAEVDALAEMYEGQHTTMAMLVSSVLPAKAGVQDALVERLLDFGAAIEGAGTGESPLIGALAFGYLSAAETLAKRGAKTDTLPAVAGLGRFADVARLLPTSDAIQRHRALALVAQHGHVEIVRLLLDAGEDPNRYNPPGFHGHSTPLHQAVCYGREGVVRLLVERKARLDIKDNVYQGTPLDWAKHLAQAGLEGYLREHV